MYWKINKRNNEKKVFIYHKDIGGTNQSTSLMCISHFLWEYFHPVAIYSLKDYITETYTGVTCK